MAKTKEELEKLKKEYQTLTSELQELSEDELKQVTGGEYPPSEAGGLYTASNGGIIKIKDQQFR